MNVVVLAGTITDILATRRGQSGQTVTTFEVTVEEAGLPNRTVPVSFESDEPPARWQHVIVVGRIGRRFTPMEGHGVSPALTVEADHMAQAHTASSAWALAQAATRLPSPKGSPE